MTPERPVEPIDQQESATPQRNRFSLLSHDLRAALSDILGGLRLVEAERLDQDTRAHFDRVTVAGETLARLLDKTLTDDPKDGRDHVTQASNVNLSQFLEDIRKRWSDRAHEKGITFDLTVAAGLPAIVTVDRVSLDRIIANLVGNAIKFTDTGTVQVLAECGDDQALSFVVTDDGPGLSQGAMARLFEYEGRPDDAGKPGSGLGLYIARELATVMGGELEVSNRSGGGVRARFCLPHNAWFDRALRRGGRVTEPSTPRQIDLSHLRIILAEDNKTNQLVATQMLRAMGARYEVASDGLEALEMMTREDFDLALLDIEMPRMSGLELIKAVRAMASPKSDTPLVALTAYVMREHRERIYAAGADGIIAKPLMSIEELGQAILDYHSGTKSRTAVQAQARPQIGHKNGSVVDRAVFDTLIETIGPDSTGELLGKLQADTDTVAEGLSRGRKALDLSEIRAQTHILISVAGAIGASPLQGVAQRLNAAANKNDVEILDDLCGECLSGLSELQAFILGEQAKAAS